MALAAVTIKIMPVSPQVDLKKIKESAAAAGIQSSFQESQAWTRWPSNSEEGGVGSRQVVQG